MAGFAKRWYKFLGGLAALAFVGCGALIYVASTWSNYHFRVAQAALECRDFEQASLHLHKYLRFRSDFEARLLAAQTSRRQGQFEVAEQQLQACENDFRARESLELERRLWHLQQGELAEADEL